MGKWVESATVGGALVQEVPTNYMYMIPILIRVHMCIHLQHSGEDLQH